MNQRLKQRITKLNNGEIPAGYKKTEFGVFPNDWETDKSFGDLFDFYGGLGKSREELSQNGVEYLHYGDMHRGEFNIVTHEEYSTYPKYNIVLKGDESYLMNDGDVAFLDASEDLEGTSRAVLIDSPENKPFIAGLHIILGKSKGTEMTKYYKQYLTSPNYIKKQFQKLAVGFKVYGVNRATIKKISCSYPANETEQNKIAEILMKWDELVTLQERMLEALLKQKKYYLSKMFPSKDQSVPEIRFAGFTAPWEQRKVSELFKITRGYVLAATQTEASPTDEMTYPVYSSQTKDNGLMGYYKDFLYEDAITWTTDGANAGTVNYRAGKFYCTNVCGVLLSDKVQANQMIAEAINRVAKGYVSYVGNPKLMNNVMADIEIKLPSNEEERKYLSTYFRNLDNLITLHQRQLEKVREQKKTMMQLLLTGIVRVQSDKI